MRNGISERHDIQYDMYKTYSTIFDRFTMISGSIGCHYLKMAVGDKGGFEKIGGEEAVIVASALLDADDEDASVRHSDDLCLRRLAAAEGALADAV